MSAGEWDPSSWGIAEANGRGVGLESIPSRARPAAAEAAAQAVRTELEWTEEETPAEVPRRRLKVRKMSSVTRRAVRWLWREKIPVGSLVLLVGREGIGKSTVAYDLAASVTRGKLPGDDFGRPRGVIVVATEDSLESTIAPRLDAAGADDDLVYEVVAETPDGLTEDLRLPVDIAALETLVRENDIAMVILDPLTSRIAEQLDTHKDADVRRALEPLTSFCEATGACVVGLMHVNKTGSGDPANQIMGSRAFPAVARAVLFIQPDEDNPDHEKCSILEVVKANLGPKGKDNLLFEVTEIQTGFDEEQQLPIVSSKIHWMGNTDRTVKDAMEASGDTSNDREEIDGASAWLRDFLTVEGGEAASTDVKREGSKAGYSESALKRARKKLAYGVTQQGYPRRTVWYIPVTTRDVDVTAGDQ